MHMRLNKDMLIFIAVFVAEEPEGAIIVNTLNSHWPGGHLLPGEAAEHEGLFIGQALYLFQRTVAGEVFGVSHNYLFLDREQNQGQWQGRGKLGNRTLLFAVDFGP